jgi:hypothetical protein
MQNEVNKLERNLLDSINRLLTDEPIEAVVIGKTDIVPSSAQNRPLSIDDTRAYLEQLPYVRVNSIGFENFGYKYPPLAVYTKIFVFFIVEFESGHGLYKIRRNPSRDMPERVLYE